MIKCYDAKDLTYLKKAGHLFLFLVYLCLIFCVVGLINPADMIMNEQEKELGLIRIISYFGIFEFFLGLVLLIFTKQKSQNSIATQ
jgi:hypothetical protein